jgi:hypothetical protein
VGDPKFETGTAIYAVAYGGGKFVAVGASGKAAYSSDGVTWTASGGTTFSNPIYGVTYGGGKFVAGGDNGKGDNKKIIHSTDGATWEAVGDTGMASYDVYAVAYGGPAGQEKFVAAGSSGKAES